MTMIIKKISADSSNFKNSNNTYIEIILQKKSNKKTKL